MSSLEEAQRAAGLVESITLPPEPGFVRLLRAIDRALAKIEEVALSVCLLALLLVGVFGALKRNFFPPAPFWSDEVIRYMVFFIGLTGAALAAHSERLFNIDMFTRAFGPRGKLVLRILTALFTITICYIFYRSGSTYLYDAVKDEEGELIPPKVGVLALPIAMVAISVHLFLHVLIAVYYLAVGKVPPELAAPKVGH